MIYVELERGSISCNTGALGGSDFGRLTMNSNTYRRNHRSTSRMGAWIVSGGARGVTLLWAVTLPLCLTISGCRSATRVPPSGGVNGSNGGPDRPRIELWVSPDSALAMLPRHPAGYVDWMAALRTGAIQPRNAIPGATPLAMPFEPQFEVLLSGPDSTTDVWFPHASHLEWLTCEQCHQVDPPAPVEPGYGNVTMTDIVRGRFCGECHGKVAFPVTGQVETCERCHRRLLGQWSVGPSRGANRRRAAPHEAVPGRVLYGRWCAMCHGETGAGDGPMGERLDPRPRDLTAALYQIRTTASGELPADEDVRRVIDEGIPGTAMPGWKNRLSDRERDSLVQYVKTLSNYFVGPSPLSITITEPPAGSAEALAGGRAVYDEMQCFKCHGDEGRGDGPSASELSDDWGQPIQPADLTKGSRFNGGSSLQDIYTRLRTGMDGTPMPSSGDAVDAGVISDEQLWQLAYYVRSLGILRGPVGDIDIQMKRITDDPNIVGTDLVGAAAGLRTDSLAVARFPHWVHRIRYRCKACHPAFFVPRAGANAMTMTEINRGEACGRCHDGWVAFRASVGNCQRCHYR